MTKEHIEKKLAEAEQQRNAMANLAAQARADVERYDAGATHWEGRATALRDLLKELQPKKEDSNATPPTDGKQ